MLIVDRITKRYGDRLVLDRVSFSIAGRDRVALVGPNGSGKSTLLRIIAGHERADSGASGGDDTGTAARYLPQGTIDATMQVAADCMPWFGSHWRLGRQAAHDASLSTPSVVSADAVVHALAAFDDAGGWELFFSIEEILRGLGIDHLRPEESVAHLSGGERTKLGLADLLGRPGSLLLLDEPTNHLDLAAVTWLERFLTSYRGPMLIASHDRALIDTVATAVIELDPETHTARRFTGGYSDYIAERERERAHKVDAYRRQQEQIDRVEADIRQVKQHAARFDNTSANDHWRRIGKKVARTAKVRERRLEKLLVSDERLEKPALAWEMKPDIVEVERAGDLVAEAHGLCLAYGERVLFDDLTLLVHHGERLVLTGANGSGKTTLLRLLLGEVLPDAGRVRLGAGIVPGYLSQQHEALDLERTPLEEIRACAALDESAARTHLHRFLFTGDDVFVKNRSLSYGQRSRLALARLILHGVNLLVLDEPMNHLDISSRERFEQALASFGGTVIAVSHDRYFIERFGTRTLLLEHGMLTQANLSAA